MDRIRCSTGETISVSTLLAVRLGTIRVYQSEFKNAVLNLVISACDAMPRGGRLIIETKSISLASDDCLVHDLLRGQYVRLSISDTGSGMPMTPPGRGEGLSFASVTGFVKQSGGYATMCSELGRGTTVYLYFPVVAAEGPHVDPGLEKEANLLRRRC